VGVKTVTLALPAEVRSVAAMAARSWLFPMKVVMRADPFQRTTEPGMKFEPMTARVKAGPPAVALLGESEVRRGAGLLTVKGRAFEVPPPGTGVKTVTCAVPATATSLAGIVAVSWPVPTKAVVRFIPFQRTTEVFLKLLLTPSKTFKLNIVRTDPATRGPAGKGC